tara:strand:- start:214 stop:774 length:561 start_codon:yes stop_codon:yes gene_type:complete
MMILGLDISTSITGVTIVDRANEIIYNEAWDTRKFKNIFDKATYVKEQILDLYDKYGLNYYGHTGDTVEHIFIEQSLQSFRSGFSSAKTLSTLSRFNGIVSWMCYDTFEIVPEYVAATSARKLAGIKIPRGTKAKEVVLKHVETQGWLEVEYTKHGNPKPQYYDRSDSIIIAKAGYYLVKESLKDE